MLVGKDTPSSSFEIEKTSGIRIQAKPTGGKDAQAVRVADEKGIFSKLPHMRDHAIHSCGDLISCFAIWARMCKNGPTGNAFANLWCGETFKFSVIPFNEILGRHCTFAPSKKVTSALGAETRTAQHKAKIPFLKRRLQSGSFALANLREGNIGDRSMASAETPLRLTMADKHNALAGIFEVKIFHKKSSRLECCEVDINPS